MTQWKAETVDPKKTGLEGQNEQEKTPNQQPEVTGEGENSRERDWTTAMSGTSQSIERNSR